MAINLKSPKAEALLKRLAEQTNESLTAAATAAFEERLARLERAKVSRQRRVREDLQRIIDEARKSRPRKGPSAEQVMDDLWGES